MLFHVILSHSSADIILISAKIIYKYSTNNCKMISAAGLLVTLLVVNSNVAVASHTVSSEQ